MLFKGEWGMWMKEEYNSHLHVAAMTIKLPFL